MKLPKLAYQKNKNLKSVYKIRLIRELVNQLVMFFLPIYFFNLHFPFWDQINSVLLQNGQTALTTLQIGLFNIVLLYGLERLVAFLSAIAVAKSTIKRGTQFAFVMGHLLYCVFVFLLFLSKDNPYWVFLAMALDGFQINYFWNSYFYSLSRNSDHKKMGSNLGIINLLLNAVTMVSPALGGIIVSQLGYSHLFLLGLVLILFGVFFSLSTQTLYPLLANADIKLSLSA